MSEKCTSAPIEKREKSRRRQCANPDSGGSRCVSEGLVPVLHGLERTGERAEAITREPATE